MGVASIVWLPVMALAGGGLGRLARALWRGGNEPMLDRWVMDVALGLGILSVGYFNVAAPHRLTPVSVCMVCFVLAGALGMPLVGYDLGKSLGSWRKEKRIPSWQTVSWVILFASLALMLMIPALAPPTGDDWDSLAYHLAMPKLYLQHHGFYYIDFASHSNFPFLVEMLYTPALSMNQPAGAKMVHYLYGVLLILAVVMLVRKHFTPKAAPLAALAIAGMPIVMWEATTAYIDLATALYTVLAVHFLLDYFDSSDRRSLIGCAISAGFAASTKMTGLALIPMLAAWLLIDRALVVAVLRHRQAETEVGRYGRVAKRGLMFVGVALLVCSPWYLKTLIYTGSPVYPFFYSIFGGRDWTAQLAHGYAASQAGFGMGHSFAHFVMLPYDLTFHWTAFCDKGQPWLIIGPILLVATPLLIVARYKHKAGGDDQSGLLSAPTSRKLVGLTLFFVAQLAIWFVLTQQSRYLIPAFAILAVIIAAVAYTDERFRIARIALYITFAATALFGVLMLSFNVERAAPVVFGSETQDEYLTQTLPIYSAEQWINNNAPRDAKIALFGDTRGFYLDRDYVWADWGHNKRFTRRFASVDDFIGYLKSQGITHAMVNIGALPPPGISTGTYKLVHQAIDKGRFTRVNESGWTGDIEPVVVGVYKIE